MFRSSGNIDEAIDEVTRWADSLPGEFSIDVTDHDGEVLIEVNGVLISPVDSSCEHHCCSSPI